MQDLPLIRCLYVRTVQARHQDSVAIPNRLNQQFAVPGKNRVWAADFTFVPTRTGWLYVAVVLDLYSRRVVGWAMNLRQSPTLVIDAWLMAWRHRRPSQGSCITVTRATSIERASTNGCSLAAGWCRA